MSVKEKFPKAKIKEQLNRILSSREFDSSRILSGFLEFVIDKTLAGQEQEIKEYTIGVHVLSRNHDFNPQLDAIVRIHAGRLRRALKEYYNDTGKNDPIQVEIPKGSYIPEFHSQNNNQPGGLASPKLFAEASRQLEIGEIHERTKLTGKKPVVAVLPFRNISKDSSRDFFADGLGEQLSTELNRFQELSVISYYSSRHVGGITKDVKEAANLLRAKYILTGSIQNDNKHLRIQAQLILGDNGEQLWTKSFERNNTASGLFEIQNEIVRSILTAIGGYYGAIFRDVINVSHSNRSNGIEIYDAIFLYYHYQKVSSVEILQKTINALEAAVKADPEYALAWAMLGEIYLDAKAFEIKKIVNPLEEGLKCVTRAVSVDPACQHAYAAKAWVYLFLNNKEECFKAADQCIAINPNASDLVGAMGFVFICAGEFERGVEIMNESLLHNPYGPWWFNLGYVFYFVQRKEYRIALHWAEKIDVPENLWDPLAKACVFGHLDRTEQAGRSLKLLIQQIPDAGTHVKDILESFLLSQELNNEILEGLKKAGLNVEHKALGLKLGQ